VLQSDTLAADKAFEQANGRKVRTGKKFTPTGTPANCAGRSIGEFGATTMA